MTRVPAADKHTLATARRTGTTRTDAIDRSTSCVRQGFARVVCDRENGPIHFVCRVVDAGLGHATEGKNAVIQESSREAAVRRPYRTAPWENVGDNAKVGVLLAAASPTESKPDRPDMQSVAVVATGSNYRRPNRNVPSIPSHQQRRSATCPGTSNPEAWGLKPGACPLHVQSARPARVSR